MPTGPDFPKEGVRFSDNPKMDHSGLNVRETTRMWMGDKLKKITGPEIAGGEVRQAAQEAGVRYGVIITDMASLKKITALVAKGDSVDSAAYSVAREYSFAVRGENKSRQERSY
jgi:hypothetical protein